MCIPYLFLCLFSRIWLAALHLQIPFIQHSNFTNLPTIHLLKNPV